MMNILIIMKIKEKKKMMSKKFEEVKLDYKEKVSIDDKIENKNIFIDNGR